MKIAEAVKRMMIAKGVSTVELVARMGLTRQTLALTLNGVSDPSLRRLAAIANALGCKVWEIVKDAEEL